MIEGEWGGTFSSLAPGKAITWRVLLTPDRLPTRPGAYRLVVSASPVTGGGDRPPAVPVTVPETSVALTIGARDGEKLRAAAERYARDAFGANDRRSLASPLETDIAQEALFSLPAADVRSVWRRLATDRTREPNQRLEFAMRLAAQGSIEATWILGEMYEREVTGRGGSSEVAKPLRSLLGQVRVRSSDRRVQEYVGRVLDAAAEPPPTR
jgi:hypothetical protein